jgi:hypothetical protein
MHPAHQWGHLRSMPCMSDAFRQMRRSLTAALVHRSANRTIPARWRINKRKFLVGQVLYIQFAGARGRRAYHASRWFGATRTIPKAQNGVGKTDRRHQAAGRKGGPGPKPLIRRHNQHVQPHHSGFAVGHGYVRRAWWSPVGHWAHVIFDWYRRSFDQKRSVS